MPGPVLGINLNGIRDYTSQHPFIDAFKYSREWATHVDGEGTTSDANLLDLDENGWIRGFTEDGEEAPFDGVFSTLFSGTQPIKAGTYSITWRGEGTVEVVAPPGLNVTERAGNRITINVQEGDTNTLTKIFIRDTDPNDTGNYIRDISVVHVDNREAFANGEIFTPEFLDKIEDFRALRFMNWMATNKSDDGDWDNRLTPESARYTPGTGTKLGVPVEVLVELANTVRADPWFTIPHLATEEYVRNFATYVRDNLEEGLIARFEYSNEMWNANFDQHQWAAQQAVEDLGENVFIPHAARQAQGIRAAEVAEIVADVFGNETGTRALNVLGLQAATTRLERFTLEAPTYVDAGYTAPKDAPFHVYAIAPYFGAGIGSADMREQVNEWIAAGEQGFLDALDHLRNGDPEITIADTGIQTAYHAAQAAELGWQLEAYEGGQHVADRLNLAGEEGDARTDFFIALVERPEFEELYTEYLESWRDNGGGLMAHFSDIRAHNQYGSWGLWESSFSENSARANAVIEFRDNTPIFWDDPRPASTFESSSEPENEPVEDPPTGPSGPVDPEPEGDPPASIGNERNVITGTNQADSLRGTREDDEVLTLGSSDYAIAGNGNDFLSGEAGADTLLGGGGNDTVEGGTSRDELYGDAGDDVILSGSGNDKVWGGLDDDTIDGGDGNDVIYGDSGDDLITDISGTSRLYGNIGNDTITSGDQNDWLYGGKGDDEISGGAGLDRIDAGDENDTVYGQNGDDVITGGNGNDSLQGDNGNDRLDGRKDDDIVRGGNGQDTIIGFLGNDTLFGDDGDDRISAEGGDDIIEGGAGNDTIFVGNGNDTVFGNIGDDNIILADGRDLVVVETDGGHDVIEKFRGGTNGDMLQFLGLGRTLNTTSEIFTNAEQVGSDVVIDLGGDSSITLLKFDIENLTEDNIVF